MPNWLRRLFSPAPVRFGTGGNAADFSSIAPLAGMVAISKADADLDEWVRGVHVGGDGNLVCTFIDGTGPFTLPVLGGQFYPYCLKRVADATTATGLFGGRK